MMTAIYQEILHAKQQQRKLLAILLDPEKVEVSPVSSTAENVEQRIYFVGKEDKRKLLYHLIRNEHLNNLLVFTRTKHGANKLTEQLQDDGISAAAIHGNKSQAQRERSLEEFRRGKSNVLVATDVAARGIHIDDVPCVVHFDPPADHKDYIHRSGRTGRAGSKGVVISLVDPSQRRSVSKLARDADVVADFVAPEFDASDPDQVNARPGEVGGVLISVGASAE